MPENCSPAALTRRQERAAELLAADDLTDEAVAAAVGIHPRTLYHWKNLPAFAAAIVAAREQFRARIMSAAFADKAKRVRARNTVAVALMRQLADADYQTVLGVSDAGEPIMGFDRHRLRELREYLDDIAEEVGDRGRDAGGVNVGVAVKVYLDPRMDDPLEADWSDAPAPRRGPG